MKEAEKENRVDQTAATRPGGSSYEWPGAIRHLQAAFRGRPYRQDALLALSVLLIGFSPQAGKTLDITPLWLITSIVQSLALIWRRKAPFTVYCTVLLACTVQWAAAESSSSNASLMIALYTLARYWTLRRLFAAIGAAVPSMVVLVVRSPPVQGKEFWDAFFLGSAIAASVALGLAARERHAQIEALAERAAHAEFEREQRARMAVLAERAGFSREMHDIVGHNLAVIVGLADGGVRQVEANPQRGRQVFELIGETGRQALADLRRTLSALRERPLDEGVEGIAAETLTPQPGVADISELLDRTRSAGPRVSYSTSGELDGLPRSVQLAIYRIVQESLTNSLKHAGPDTNVQVAIEVGEESLCVSVSDTGAEFHRSAAAASFAAALGLPGYAGQNSAGQSLTGQGQTGQGLTGVRERAALAGGSAEAGPNEAGGWTVTARFPAAQFPSNPPNPSEAP